MLHFLIRKLRNKKWMNGCIVFGLVILVGMISALPMFKNGAYNNLLLTGFEDYIKENNKCPAAIGKVKKLKKEEAADIHSIHNDIEDYKKIWLQYLKLSPEAVQTSISLAAKSAKGNYSSGDYYLQIACMPEMEKHIRIVNGKGYGKDENTCIVSGSLMDEYGLVTGETLTFDLNGPDGKPVTLNIAGIYDIKDMEDLFWYRTPEDMDKTIFVSEETFDKLLKSDVGEVSYQCNMMFDYRDITSKNVDNIRYYLKEFHRLDNGFFDTFSSTLGNYTQNAKTVSVIIYVLELPVMALLLAFIYMVSNQIMEMEAGEIATLKSRGVKKWQIVRLYLGQSLVLDVVALLPGLLLGLVFCRIAAGTDGFMKFAWKAAEGYTPTGAMIIYGVIALLAADLFIVLPVFRHQKQSVVEHKHKNVKRKERPFWNRYYLDFILAGITVYLMINYNRQRDATALSILNGQSVDPIMFLDAIFFVLAMGLISLRLLYALIRLIYRLGEKKFSPVYYTSFLQMIRTFYKQGFLNVFIIMTIAMGSFYANMAQTVNENKAERLAYNLGADVVLEEEFQLNIYHPEKFVVLWQYEEPDYGRYNELQDRMCDSMTKVIEDDNAEVRIAGESLPHCHLMAVQTKEFGKTAMLKEGLNDKHWYYALNELAAMPNGVIISENLAKDYDLKVGDELIYTRFSPIKREEGKEIAISNAKVCAIVKAWPGHQSYRYDYNSDGEVEEKDNYLLVTNYAYTVSVFGLTPYRIWMKLKEGSNTTQVEQYLEDKKLDVGISSIDEQIKDMKKSALIKITNGMFTLSFVVAVLLCVVGFFIYWFNNIRQRELLFGIYRAMGMRMEELKKMLVSEQIFSSLFAALFGGGIGILTTVLFAKILAVVYLPMQHNIPVFLIISVLHMLGLAVLFGVMFIVCIRALWYKIRQMKIAQVLKLGED